MLLCSFNNSPRPWPLDLGVVGACNGAPLNAGDSSVTRAQKAGGATYSLMSSQAHRLAELHDYLLSACRVCVPRVSLQWSLWIEIDRLGSQSGWLFCTRAGADQVLLSGTIDIAWYLILYIARFFFDIHFPYCFLLTLMRRQSSGAID
jgi:hypothetical protein